MAVPLSSGGKTGTPADRCSASSGNPPASVAVADDSSFHVEVIVGSAAVTAQSVAMSAGRHDEGTGG